MKDKVRIAIISSKFIKTNRAVSSVKYILDNLDAERYEPSLVFIDGVVTDKSLLWNLKEMKNDPRYMPFELIEKHSLIKEIYAIEDLRISDFRKLFDVAIVVIYNDYGEDGKIPGLLDVVGLPYMNAGLLCSAVCFDKATTKIILSAKGIIVAPGYTLTAKSQIAEVDKEIKSHLSGYPVIMKKAESGASYGVWMLKSSKELEVKMKEYINRLDQLMLEQYIRGQEFTIGVIGNYINPTALPPVLIKPKNEFFDYNAKYRAGMAEELCPAPITKSLEEKLKKTAIQAYNAVKCEYQARIDIVVDQEENIYVLEINTYPGIGPSSLFPRELEAAGLSMKNLIESFVKTATLTKSN